jgi:hypothetical protein
LEALALTSIQFPDTLIQLAEDIRETFGLNCALTEGTIEVKAIDKEFVERLFRSIDFSTSSNATPGEQGHLIVCFESDAAGRPGTVPWSKWLTAEIAAVDAGCDRLLLRFGSGHKPEIVEQISLMHNRANVLSSTISHVNFACPTDNDILLIWHFFEHLKLSTQLIDRIRSSYKGRDGADVQR